MTFIASFDPQSRVAYIDQNNNLKNSWDSNDVGATVTFISSADSKEYEFTIASISADGLTATLTYTDNNGDFKIEDFEGTATYEVAPLDQQQATINQLQAANGSLTENVPNAIAHLHNGTKLVAEVEKGNNSIKFSHVGTSFFRIAIKVPEGGITTGSELVVRANGLQIGKVKLNFDLDYDPNPNSDPLVAYLRATTQQDATRLSYTIIRGEDTYSYKSVFSSLDLVEGTYYYTDLTSKTVYEMPKSVFDKLGNASVDVHPVDLGIYLDDNEELVNEANATKKLLIGDRFLGASRPGDDDVLYFYFGETVGHRVNLSTGVMITNAGDPEGFSYTNDKSKYGQEGYATYAKQTKNELINNGFLKKDPSSSQGFVLTEEYDAAHVQLGGGWRMMSRAEAMAFYAKLGETCFNIVQGAKKCECRTNRAEALRITTTTALIDLPMVGCIEGEDLRSSYRRHGENEGAVTCSTWSRDVNLNAYDLEEVKVSPTVSKYVITRAYSYGAIDIGYEDYIYYFGQSLEDGFSANDIYIGAPILPCMVVDIEQ